MFRFLTPFRPKVDRDSVNGAPGNVGPLKATHKAHHIVCAAIRLPVEKLFCSHAFALFPNGPGIALSYRALQSWKMPFLLVFIDILTG